MTLESNDEAGERGKLFVGGLSWETSVEKLSQYFSAYGEVTDCVVMKNPETGRSRGFGFVTFTDPNCVQLVLANGPHQLDDRTIDPKSCNAKSAQKGRREAKMSNYPKVFLGGLPVDVNETVLRDFFSKFGKVIEVVIMYDQEKKKTRGNGFRGFGFLSFDSEAAVNSVVAEHYVTINGKKVEVKRAEPRDKQSSPGNKQISGQNNAPSSPAPGFGGAPQPYPVHGGWWGPPPPGHQMPPPPGGPPVPGQPYPGWGAPVAWPPAPGYGYGAPWPGYAPAGPFPPPPPPSQPAAWPNPSQGPYVQPYGTAHHYPNQYPGTNYGQPPGAQPAPNLGGQGPPMPGPAVAPPPAGNGYSNAVQGPPGQAPSQQPPPMAPIPPNVNPSQQGVPAGNGNAYAQPDSSSYGPARVYNYGPPPPPATYNAGPVYQGNTNGDHMQPPNGNSYNGHGGGTNDNMPANNGYGSAPPQHQPARHSSQVQPFHPYRR